jgi:uracil-DNA glycosylase family 4
MFTGDRSGEWLYRALHRFGFSDRPVSLSRRDGLELRDCYISAALRCAPPLNKPSRDELLNCRPYLAEELRLLGRAVVVVGLGRIAFDAAVDALRSLDAFAGR